MYLKQKLILLLLYPPLCDVLLSLLSTNYSVFLYKLCKSAIIVRTQYCGIFKIAAVLSIAHYNIAFKPEY